MAEYDSEDYSSSEDEDYVPSGGEYSEDDVNELVKEDDDDDEDMEGGVKTKDEKSKKKNTKCIAARKRKKGGLVLDTEEQNHEESRCVEEEEEDHTDLFTEEKKRRMEETKKKKEEDLWSSFLSDVGQKPKTEAPVSPPKQTEEPKTSSKSTAQKTEAPKPEAAKVTITKVFDFAGEQVTVKKEVDSTSKEAKEFIKQQEQQHPGSAPSAPGLPTGSGVKRPVGMSSILGKIGSKKQKLSTLEKSKLDWETFKDQEGIRDELAIHNRGKDGYIERKAFLDRVDYRQFELEREVRLKNMKPT